MKIENMRQGMVLHSYGRDRSPLRRKCSWPVRIVSVDLDRRTVVASWNGNPPMVFHEKHATKWHKKPYTNERTDR